MSIDDVYIIHQNIQRLKIIEFVIILVYTILFLTFSIYRNKIQLILVVQKNLIFLVMNNGKIFLKSKNKLQIDFCKCVEIRDNLY